MFRISAIVFSIVALLFVVGIIFVSKTIEPKLVEKFASRIVYYRLKANYTYKSEQGPGPWSFDIVAGCGVSLTKYVSAGISSFSTRFPTLYARATPDNHMLMIEVPRPCGGQTTENGSVPKDFFPAVVFYETAGDFTLGMLYATEDAYEGPLSRLTFHGATISTASKEEFEQWMTAEQPKNLVPAEASKDVWGAYEFVLTDELKQNPGAFWKTRMPNQCYGVVRLRMPEKLKAQVRRFWPSDKPRYWALPRKQADKLRESMWYETGFDEKVKEQQILFDGHSFRIYQVFATAEAHGWGAGLVTRRGGGNFIAANAKIKNPPIRALPAEYFPMTMTEGLPWIKMADPNTTKFIRNFEIGDGSKRGFFYCYWKMTNGPAPLMQHFIKTFDPAPGPWGWGSFPAERRVDGSPFPNGQHDYGRLDLGSVFFDRDEYILWQSYVLL